MIEKLKRIKKYGARIRDYTADLLNITNRIYVNELCQLRLPSLYRHLNWIEYEKRSVKVACEILKNNDYLFIDIGCERGMYSAIASSFGRKVIAIDSNIASLKSTQYMCRYYNQPKLICGLVSNIHNKLTLEEAIEDTKQKLTKVKNPTNPNPIIRINIFQNPTSVLYYSLDDLLKNEKNMFIKCDVDGAEFLVLKGAFNILKEKSPILLISVHPNYLKERYQHTPYEIRKWLEELGYKIEIIEIDHEEHWLCKRLIKPPAITMIKEPRHD